jgi:4-hydroxyacetophenone monooxygenase
VTATTLDREAYAASLRTALAEANVPTLQMLVVQLTADESWLKDPYLPTRSRGVDDNDTGGLPAEVQDELREAAFRAILEWKAGKPAAIPHPASDQLVRMMSVSVGENVPDDYGPFMAAKFDAFTGVAESPVTHAVPDGFTVLIVGAGMAGICAAVRLNEAGIPFRVVEKGETVGGVWRQNRYPGCGVDTPSHLYSYSFAQGDWDRYFGSRAEILGNFEKVVREHGLLDRIQFNTEVVEARYDGDRHRWLSEVSRADGTTEVLESNVLICGVGAFGTPKWPSIPGLEQFRGTLLHTALWDEGARLAGRRVGVIGNGASAMQLAPAIVDEAESLTIFQRSRQWAAPFPKFHKPLPAGIKFLCAEIPLYEWWYRLRLSWIFDSKVYDSLKVDPDWGDPKHSLNAINDAHRRFFTRYILEELGDRQDLAPHVVPDFPPYGKRMLLDNGWFRMLTRPDVELIDTPIECVDADGVRLTDGRHVDLDVLVAASGFDVARFLAPINVYGRNGISIREAWNDDDPRAYLGTVVPKFPNLFTLYGPNTALGHGGSFMFVVECQVNYVLTVLDAMFANDLTEVECREDVCARYNDTMADMHSRMIWTHPGMSTYYRNSKGRVVMNSPWRTTDYWKLTSSVNLDDYTVQRGARRASPGDAGRKQETSA